MTDTIKNKTIVLDALEVASKTVIGLTPAGALYSAIWDSVKSKCVEKRFQEWKNKVEDRVRQMEITMDELGENEKFTTALFQATQSAIQTAETKKRDYLANVVRNSVSCDLEDSVFMIFLDLIHKYTVWHINILLFFENPENFDAVRRSRYSMGSPITLLEEVYPELKAEQTLVNKMIRELYVDGLLTNENMNTTMTENGMKTSRTTKLGNQFLDLLRD